MVERTEAGTGITEFAGTCVAVSAIEGNFGPQFHIEIEPEDKTIIKAGKTGKFHEFLRLPGTATKKSIPAGSVVDTYIAEVEAILPESKKFETVEEVLKLLVDKKAMWRKKALGKAYKGHSASEHWVPVNLI